MQLKTTTNVSVDGVMQGLGGPDEDRTGGFERGGWAIPLLDTETGDYLNQVYGGAARVPIHPRVGQRCDPPSPAPRQPPGHTTPRPDGRRGSGTPATLLQP